MRPFVAVFFALIGAVAVSESRVIQTRSIDLKASNANLKDFRLPNGVSPLSYRLTLRPLLSEGRFSGRVHINVTCEEQTKTITLHVHEDLQVSHSEVRLRLVDSGNGSETSRLLSVSSTKKDLARQWYVISLTEELVPGFTYQLELAFSGNLVKDRSIGFFVNGYEVHRTHEKRLFAATQMRPNHPRRVFPCFDGPMYKATFDISLVRPSTMMSLSNMPIKDTEKVSDEPGWEIDHFETTPLMSTFSVAAIICDLGFVTPLHPALDGEDGPAVRVFGRAHMLGKLQEAADQTPKVIKWLQDYFGMPYPLPQIDIIALPHYSAPNPSDLWGVIVFREEDLVNDASKLAVLTTELVYQWLGHLTTPFTRAADIHINKALVNYITASYLLESKEYTGTRWALRSSYSLYYEYSRRTPYANVPSLKEEIRADKTQWLFRMLNFTLTERTFKAGIRNFLQDSQYKMFTEDDLFKSMTEVAWIDGTLLEPILVGYIVDSWSKPDRFPVVTITRNYYENTAHIEQHMFLRERPHDAPNKSTQLWWVPIMLLSQDNLDIGSLTTLTWMQEQKDISIADMPPQDAFIIANPEEIGMFMVNYDTENWKMLSEYLKMSGSENDGSLPLIPTATRAKLLHDSLNLAYGGELSFNTALDMTLFLVHEKDPQVWETFFNMVDHIGRHIGGTPAARKFQLYVAYIVSGLYISMNTEGQSDGPPSQLAHSAKYTLCSVGYTPCVQEARDAYTSWMQMDDPDEGKPFKDSYLCPVFKWGDMEEWEFGLQRLIHLPISRHQNERMYLLKVVAGCPIAEEKIIRFLNITILENNGNFTDSDIHLVLNMLSGNAEGYTALFHFVAQNWDAIRKRCENNPSLWEHLIYTAISHFNTQEGLDMVSELYVSRNGQFGNAEQIVEDALKIIKVEAEWSNENLPVIEAWLDSHLSLEPNTPTTESLM